MSDNKVIIKAFAAALAISTLAASSACASPPIARYTPAVCSNNGQSSTRRIQLDLIEADRVLAVFDSKKACQFTLEQEDGTVSRKAGYELDVDALDRKAAWRNLRLFLKVPEKVKSQGKSQDNNVTPNQIIITIHVVDRDTANNRPDRRFVQKSFSELNFAKFTGDWQSLTVSPSTLSGFGKDTQIERVVVYLQTDSKPSQIIFGGIEVRHSNDEEPDGTLSTNKGDCRHLR